MQRSAGRPCPSKPVAPKPGGCHVGRAPEPRPRVQLPPGDRQAAVRAGGSATAQNRRHWAESQSQHLFQPQARRPRSLRLRPADLESADRRPRASAPESDWVPAMPQLPPPQLTGLILQARPFRPAVAGSAPGLSKGRPEVSRVRTLLRSPPPRRRRFPPAPAAPVPVAPTPRQPWAVRSPVARRGLEPGPATRVRQQPLAHPEHWSMRQCRYAVEPVSVSARPRLHRALRLRPRRRTGPPAARRPNGWNWYRRPRKRNRAAARLVLRQRHLVARQRLAVRRQMQCLAIWKQPAEFLSAHPRPGSHAGHVQMHKR
jgi:hypothetical protein